jgi:hypothetical protein
VVSQLPTIDLAAPTAPADGSTPSTPPPARGRRRTLLVAASSSLVTAVIAVIIAATLWPAHSTNTSSDDQVGHSTSASTKTTTQTSTQPSNTASATAATSPPASPTNTSDTAVSASAAIRSQGGVVITSSYVDLDSVPVNNGVNTVQEGSIYNSTNAFSSTQYTLSTPSGNGLLATFPGTTPPTRAQCYDQVSSQGVSQVTVTDGTMVCVITPAGRVALLTVTDDQADGNNGIKANVVVWSQIVATTPTGPGD